MRFRQYCESLEDLPADPEQDAKSTKEPKDTTPEEPKNKSVEDAPEEPKTLKFIFDENESEIKTFVPKKVYDAKRVEDSFKAPAFPISRTSPKGMYTTHDDDYMIRDHENINRTWAIKHTDYNKTFVQVNANQKPDAEGYIMVRRSIKLDAYLYTGEDVKLQTGKTLTKNTYLFRADGSKSDPVMLGKTEFESDYEAQ